MLTHTIPNRFIYELSHTSSTYDKELTAYLATLYDRLGFKKWFAGHWHIDLALDCGKMNIMFEEIYSLDISKD